MFQIGPLELVVVLVIALLVIGPQRLPDVARSLGRGMREFRSALSDEGDDSSHQPARVEPPAQPAQPAAAPEPPPAAQQQPPA